MKGNMAYCCFKKKKRAISTFRSTNVTLLFHDKADYDVRIKCVGFQICCADNLNKVYYCHVYRSCMLKSGMHPSFGWKYEKYLSSMHAERCCTIAFYRNVRGAVVVGK